MGERDQHTGQVRAARLNRDKSLDAGRDEERSRVSAASHRLGDSVVCEASEAFTLVRRQHQQLCRVGHQLLENGACGIVCDGADAFDLDAQFQDVILRAAFLQDSPANEERSDAREILEVFAFDRRVDVHHCQLPLHEAGELHGVGERRRIRGGEISGMKDPSKREHRWYLARFALSRLRSSAVNGAP